MSAFIARRHAWLLTGVALVLRLGVVAWAAARFPPTADGAYYHQLAARLAAGQGYTWAWPDGVITPAAHYPVGYPAMLGALYVILGTSAVVAMVANAFLGAAGAWATYDVLRRATTPNLALAGGLAVALHPALVPYTVALMTESVAASLLVVAAAFAARAGGRTTWLLASGVIMGAATLVRPQLIALAPVFGWFVTGVTSGRRTRVRRAAALSLVALTVCAPWTARNCLRMDKCALVSVNGGWNLAIGTQTVSGGWQPLVVPEVCKEVFAEAAKDDCFGREARRVILADKVAWLARIPSKLRVTFDYFGAAPWYLHEANPAAFSDRAKVVLGGIETVFSRALLLASLVAVRGFRGPRRVIREGVAGVGLVACFAAPGVVGYLACGLAVALLGREALERQPVIVPVSAAVILGTAATHAVFFGAGRYGLLVVPFVTALAFVRSELRSESTSGTRSGVDAVQAIAGREPAP